MKSIASNQKTLTVSILSLSLLTVMAGAAVAPALGVIKEYFADSDQLFVQMIISMPALFIVLTNLFFGRLAERFGARTLVISGLLLYTAGGCAAGLFDSIGLVLAMRALVGIGVGIIMPLSTGLLSYYFPPERQEGLMGWSSAMNQMGGVAATLISGLLANISWRLSFLVYLMGLISIVLCLAFMPNDRIGAAQPAKEKGSGGAFGKYYTHIIAMFLLMTAFFLYPANFAIVTAAEGIIPAKYTSVIMAGMDLVAFFGGLLFVSVKRLCGRYTKYAAPALFFVGYALLAFTDGGWAGVLAGSACVGFANGCGVPCIISAASREAGRSAATDVMPLISAALYLAQFLSPFILSLVRDITASGAVRLPYYTAVAVSAALLLWSGVRQRR
ncbi:MAG: MFS transporter [Oscillospiraceae bacterium]